MAEVGKRVFKEIGAQGLKEWQGFIAEAYSTKLQWPSVQPLFNKIRRSDPEIAQVRHMFAALSRAVDYRWELPDNASDDDRRAQEFGEQVLDDMEGGFGDLLETAVSQVPFMGWGVWEAIPCVRKPDWRPPDDDMWRSQYDDGLIGFRRLAWRDTSSLDHWEFAENGRPIAMVQRPANKIGTEIVLPLEQCLHLTFGDSNNPEGLSPLEAVYRLERIKYGLEVVQGIGFEHSAGFLSVKLEEATPTAETKAMIAEAARNILTAQEGNYALWPKGVTGELIDSAFSASSPILEAIKYYGILKLAVYNMQWAAMSTTSSTGSYSAHQDSSQMFLTFYNAMLEGFVKQFDNQIGRRLFEYNKEAFPGMTRRPRLIVTPIQKDVSLDTLSQFIRTAFDIGLLQTEDDWISIRKHTGGVLPESLPEGEEIVQQEKPESESEQKKEDNTEQEDEKKVEDVNRRDMARRPFVVGDDEHTDYDATVEPITDEDLKRSIAKLKRENKRKKLGLDSFIAFLEAITYEGEDD